jgi:dynein heavy chain
MLAGGLMLRDLGLAPGISSNGVVGIELNAIVMENEALPVFAEARDCLQCIDRRDIVEVRTMKTPPNTVLYVVEAIGCVLGEQRGRAWENTKEILKSPQTLLEKLIGFDPDDDAVRICHVLGPYIESDFFEPERVLRASRACGALCQWCHALHTYCRFAEATGLA